MFATNPSLLNPAVYQALVRRIASVSARSLRRWGTMRADEMLCHCTDQIRLALAQKPATETASWLNRTIAIRVALALPRIPVRNLATPTDMRQGRGGLGTPPTTLDHDKQLLLNELAAFLHWPADQPLAPHPGYGPLSRPQWARFVYLHLDHHLRQFGG